MTDAVGSIDMPDAQDEAPDSQKKTRKGGKRAKQGPLKRLALYADATLVLDNGALHSLAQGLLLT